MHYKSLIDSDYLGQWDFPNGAKATVIIKSVDKFVPKVERSKKCEDCRGQGQFLGKPCGACSGAGKVKAPNKRIKITFQGKRKAWLAGPVSLEAIAGMYGKDTDGWIGRKITLYVDAGVKFGKETTGGVRVVPTRPSDSAPVTPDPLDRPVDEERAAMIDEAAGRTQ